MDNKTSFSHKNQEPESGVLYMVGTPIGNLSDLSIRALNILKNVSLIACEDTRQTKKIMNRYEFSNKLISFNKHNSLNKIPKLINDLKSGKSIALVSDAGMPSICDPGEEFVNKARGSGIETICIPGPCAAITALVSSGLPSSRFVFEGFLPKKFLEREKILYEISKSEKTVIIYEAPHRINKLLKELKEFCGGDRKILIARELTKKFEEHMSSSIEEVIKSFESKKLIGEFTLVIKGQQQSKQEFEILEIKKELKDLINSGISLSIASKYLSKKVNLSKKTIYSLHVGEKN